MRGKKKQGAVMNIGTSSMIVILIGLSFAVLAALAISQAKNDDQLSNDLAEHTKAYYQAVSVAEQKLGDIDTVYEVRDENNRFSFAVAISEGLELDVTIHFADSAQNYDIEQWQVVNTSDWEGSDAMPGLFTGP
jgi:hypothetical protein